jgi:hypothetical protein
MEKVLSQYLQRARYHPKFHNQVIIYTILMDRKGKQAMGIFAKTTGSWVPNYIPECKWRNENDKTLPTTSFLSL